MTVPSSAHIMQHLGGESIWKMRDSYPELRLVAQACGVDFGRKKTLGTCAVLGTWAHAIK